MRRAVVLAALSAVLPALHRLIASRCAQEDEDEGERERDDDHTLERRRRRRTRREGDGDDGGGGGGGPPPASSYAAAAAMEELALRRRRSLRRFFVRLVAVVVPPLRLANHLCFLLRGTERQPATLPMRLAGLAYAPLSDDAPAAAGGSGARRRHVNLSYARRRVLYEEAYALATSALLPSASAAAAVLTAAPASAVAAAARIRDAAAAVARSLLPAGRVRQWNGAGGRGPEDSAGGCGADEDDGGAATTTSSLCPLCSSSPWSATPYVPSPCGHVHCYVCLRIAALDDPNYMCRRCGMAVESSRPA